MKRVHFIGAGGYSMSGLALLMKQQGYEVTGSDVNATSRTERLRQAGITVYTEHVPENVHGADWVIYNTDVSEQNPERQEASRDPHIRLMHRSELLAEILTHFQAIAVSGTHGKTTTTSMIGHILMRTGWDPTVLVGGEVPGFSGNLRIGRSAWAVAEADESDGTFLRYHPFIAVATNVEPEHLDHFHNSFDEVVRAFEQFIGTVPKDGLAILGIDNPVLKSLAARTSAPLLTFGWDDTAQLWPAQLVQKAGSTTFTAVFCGKEAACVHLPLPGRHNVLNALAALAACHHAGVSWEKAAAGLADFQNAARRFQTIASVRGIRIVDDYAHHPSEIRATLAASRQITSGRTLAVFQPQRYVRTQSLWKEFAQAFTAADEIFLTEIYSPPGEQ
ncbi:MAG: UDP-N-acetylmuramate--L-alanine ligase, partial [Firmicutes bacterium]|nr:UDP-N-acetylmuramate--L-alanine ligase [Bacillota bacterium]